MTDSEMDLPVKRDLKLSHGVSATGEITIKIL
jgi:hypothetical protein